MTKFSLVLLSLGTILLIGLTEGYLEVKERMEEPSQVQQVQKEPMKTPTIMQKASATKPEVEVKETETSIPKKNILLLGSDTRVEDQLSRSDAIMLVQLDPDTRTINYVSVPRDAYVDIVGKGYKDKINHAMAYGIEYSVDTVENLFGIEIDNYFVIDFFAFERVIDKLGGVEVDVPFTFTEQNAKGKQHSVKINKGVQTLSGEEALAYARMRKQDNEGDIGRAKRQQELVESVLNRFKSSTSYEKISVIKEVYNEITTDIDLKGTVNYIDYLYNYTNINKHVLSGKGVMIDGVYYMQLDNSLNDAIEILTNTVPKEETEQNTKQDINNDKPTHLQ